MDGKVHCHLLEIFRIGEFLLHFIIFLQEIFRMLQKDVTVPGEMDVSSLPFKEGDTQLLFQPPDGSRKGRLEEELGVTLFEREGRNIHLTRDGHILLKHAENFLQEYDEMQQEFADSKNLQQMTVNLAIHSATKLIPSFLAEFRKDHPEAHAGNHQPRDGSRSETYGSHPLFQHSSCGE